MYDCGNGKCISAAWLCDTLYDCPGGEDEASCPSCSNTEMQCANYQCVSASRWCDGTEDCADRSDENSCVSLGELNVLYGDRAGTPTAFCSEGWTSELASHACRVLRHGSAHSWQEMDITMPETDVYVRNPAANPSSFMGQFSVSQSCSTQKIVSVECQPRSCGKRMLNRLGSQRIVNGDIAAEGSSPWQVSLQRLKGGKDFHFCGGSIINERWIVTAAHCVDGDTGDVKIRMGSVWTHLADLNAVYRQKDTVITHPLYKTSGHGFDLALIKVDVPITFSEYLQPICLADDTFHLSSDSAAECYTTGWGDSDGYNGINPSYLRQAKMKLIHPDACHHEGLRNATTICARYASGHIAACNGDSGGPLVYHDGNDRWFLNGVAGRDANKCNKFSVYTRISTVVQWIYDTVNQYNQ